MFWVLFVNVVRYLLLKHLPKVTNPICFFTDGSTVCDCSKRCSSAFTPTHKSTWSILVFLGRKEYGFLKNFSLKISALTSKILWLFLIIWKKGFQMHGQCCGNHKIFLWWQKSYWHISKPMQMKPKLSAYLILLAWNKRFHNLSELKVPVLWFHNYIM